MSKFLDAIALGLISEMKLTKDDYVVNHQAGGQSNPTTNKSDRSNLPNEKLGVKNKALTLNQVTPKDKFRI